MKMKLLSGGFRKGSVHGVAPSVMLLAVTATLLNVVPTPAFGASTSLKQSTEVTLTLGASAGHVDDVVDVDVSVASESEGPALVVFRVSYDETALEYVDVNEGAAATAAEKIVTGNLRSDGDLGIAVWGLNFNAIPDGVLMTLSFRILAGTEGEYLSLTGSKASAASAEDTPQRLEIAVVPGQIRIGDPCVAPDAPTNIDASDGTYDEYIRVQWDAVSGAAEYRVYRGLSSDINAAAPLTDWLTATSYDDTSAAPATDGGGSGCQGAQSSYIYYYYWVKAASEDGCQSAFSASDRGHRGAGKALAVASLGPLPGRGLSADAAVSAVLVAMLFVAGRSQVRRKGVRSALHPRT